MDPGRILAVKKIDPEMDPGRILYIIYYI